LEFAPATVNGRSSAGEFLVSTDRQRRHLFSGQFSRQQYVCIQDFIGAKDDGDGGDNCSCKTRKAPVKSSPPTKQNPTFYRPDALSVTQPTV